jgi:Mg2+ and Co2+ transporter CorA
MLSGNGPEDKGAAKERLPPSVTGRAKTPRTAFRGSILTLQKCMPSANEGCGMLTVYRLSEKGLEEATAGETAVPPDAAWVDLRQPTIDEDRAVEKFIGAALPSREETEEIEFSSRFYAEDGAVFMTASLLTGIEVGKPALAPFTVVVTGDRIATVRHDDLRAVRQFVTRAAKPGKVSPTAR